MPELPEVETSVQAIQKFRNQHIESIKIFNPNLRWKVNRKPFQKLHGKKVKNITRRAKYILLNVDEFQTCATCFKMVRTFPESPTSVHHTSVTNTKSFRKIARFEAKFIYRMTVIARNMMLARCQRLQILQISKNCFDQ